MLQIKLFMNLCSSCVYDQVYSFGSTFNPPCMYQLRSTDNKIRTIKKIENLCNIPMFSRK